MHRVFECKNNVQRALFQCVAPPPNVLRPRSHNTSHVLRFSEVLRNVLRGFDNNFSSLRRAAALQHFFSLKIDGDVYVRIRIRI